MIFITGDTHGEIDIAKLSSRFFQAANLGDYVIIAGDFGFVWRQGSERDAWWLKNFFDAKPFTTLFVDGNHENFDLLEQYPVTEKWGGNVQQISERVYHLMRGQIYSIDGQVIFTMGGASSHDKAFRQQFVNWWPQELPSRAEEEIALANLEAWHWKVDYVITHCAPTNLLKSLSTIFEYEPDSATNFLAVVAKKLKFTRWYFGHYHLDRALTSHRKHYTAIYREVIPI